MAHYGCRELIEMGVVDILQTDINHVGGITALWKVAQMAAAVGHFDGASCLRRADRRAGDAARGCGDAELSRAGDLQRRRSPDPKEKVWEEWLGFPAMRMVNGRFPLPDKPGLGFELTEKALAKYPFGGTRPMARVFHEDGSVAEW